MGEGGGVKRSLLVAGLLLLAGCGSPAEPTSSSATHDPVPGDFLAEATAVEELPGGTGFAITVTVPAGADGCASRPKARYFSFENRTHYATTTVRSSGGDCPEQASAVVELEVPTRGRDLALNNELWTAGPGRAYVRCSTAVGCHPPRDRCDEVWTNTVAESAEIPPERQIRTVACEVPWLVVDVDAVVTGCQSVDGSTPPAGCEGSGVHTRWFAELDEDRGWQVVASGTASGCADVAEVPDFPRRLCEGLVER